RFFSACDSAWSWTVHRLRNASCHGRAPDAVLGAAHVALGRGGGAGSEQTPKSTNIGPMTNRSHSFRMPDKPSLDGIEAKWVDVWDESGVHHFDRTVEREDVFSIDTPPPTVSGSLHIGHVFSYTHT